nr:ras guanyl-nucleotide exchange factor [Naematelia aurantialba]
MTCRACRGCCYATMRLARGRSKASIIIPGQLDASGTSTVLLGCKSDPDAVLEVAAADANALCQPYDIGLIEVTIATTEGKGKMHNAVRWLLFKLEQRQRRRERQSSVDSTAETAPAQLKTKTATMKPLDSLVSPDSDASSGADRFMWYRRGPELGKSGHERGPGGHGGDGHVSDTRSSSSSLQWIMGSKPSTGNDKRDSAGGRSSLSTEGTGSAAVPAPASPSAQRPAEHILDTRLNAVRAPESLSPYTSLDGLMNQLFTAITSATNERFVRAFLLTFRRFCYTHQLMAEFLERFRQVERDSASDEERRWALMRMTGALLEWTKRYPGDLASEQTRGLFRDVVDLLLKHTFMAHLTADLVSVQGSIMDVVDLDASWSFGEKRAAPSITSTSTGLDVDRELSDDVDALDFGDKEKTPSSRTVSTASLVVGGDLQASLHDGSDKKTSLDTGSNLSASLHTDLQTSLSRGSNLSASLRGDLHPSLSRGSSLRAPASSPKSPNGSAVQLKRSNTRSRTKLGRGSAADSAASVSRFGLGDDDLGFSQWASAWAYVVQQDANDVAVNLTRMQWALFAAIRPRDVFRHDLGKEKDGPVGQSILFFNHISRWVTTMILASPKAKHRARIYERFMLIAHQLRRLNNYDCLYAITSGMSETSVHRLAQTQQLVVAQAAPALQQDFKSHMDLMEPRGGYLRYRKAIAADLAHGRSAIPLL